MPGLGDGMAGPGEGVTGPGEWRLVLGVVCSGGVCLLWGGGFASGGCLVGGCLVLGGVYPNMH